MSTNCNTFSSDIQQNFFNIGDFNCDGVILKRNDITELVKKLGTEYNRKDVTKYVTKHLANFDYNNQESAVQRELDKLREDAQKLYNGKFGSAICTLNEGCVELNNDTIISNKLLQLSSQSQSHINIINHKISDNQYDIYILGDEILELLVNFEVPSEDSLKEDDIKVTDTYKLLFNNLFTNDNYQTNGLDAFKIYNNNLYVARLSNNEKITSSSIPWNLKEFNDNSGNNNYKMFQSTYPIKNVVKNRYVNIENQITDTNNVNIINI